MPLFPALLDELRVTLAKRRRFIDSTLDSPIRCPFPQHSPHSAFAQQLDHHSVYVKQKVLSQIRDFQKKEDDLRASLMLGTPAANPTPEEKCVEIPVPRGWSLWSLLGY